MYILLEVGDKCPACNSDIISNSYGEDEAIYIECQQNDNHYSRFIGLNDDITE